MFADAEVEVAAVVLSGLKVSRAVESKARFGGGIKIRGSTHEPGDIFCQGVQHFGGRLAGCQALCIRWKRGQILVPLVGKLMPLHARVLIR